MNSNEKRNLKIECSNCSGKIVGKPYVWKGKSFHSKECAENYKCAGRKSSSGHGCCG